MPSERWRFAGFSYSAQRGLERGDQSVDLQPKVRGLLELLLRARGDVVKKSAISEALWPGVSVSDDSIARSVSLLRRALVAHGGDGVLKTVYGSGVRLSAKVVHDGQPVVASGPVAETAAIELMRTAYEVAASRTEEGLKLAQATLRLACDRHPAHLPAWALFADVAAARVIRGFLSPTAAAREIDVSTSRALAIDPHHVASMAVRGWALAILQGRAVEGRELLGRCAGENEQQWLTFFYRAWVAAADRRIDDALAIVERGLVLSPLERALLSLRAWLTLCAGRSREADELAIVGLSARPDIELLLLVRCVAAAQAGAPARSVKFAREAAAASNQDGFSLAFLAWAHANAGDTEETHAILARLRNRPAPKALMASVRLAQGDRRGATNLLQTANREHCPWASLAWCDPRLSPLSSQQAR